MTKFAILLSIYNGEDWIEELVHSISQLEGVNFRLIVRDDCSTDNSIELLKKLEIDLKLEIEVCKHFDKNLGVGKSFWHLISHAKENEYVAFCDQDDIWCPDKLAIAQQKLCLSSEYPSIFASRVLINKFDYVWPNKHPILSFENSLFQNVLIGCTLVLNPSFTSIINQIELPEKLLHDSLIYSIAVCRANIIYEMEPQVIYRIHSNNDSGINIYKFRNLRQIFNSARKLISHYKSLSIKWKYLSEFDLICDKHRVVASNLFEASNMSFIKRFEYILKNGSPHNRKLIRILYIFFFLLGIQKV